MLDKVDSSMWHQRHFRMLVLVSLAMLSGCASSVVVKPDIPNPLVEKLPLNTALVYSEEFKNYVYLETEKKRGSLKSLDFTDAQTTMLEQVFGSLTNLVAADDTSRNLSIEPEILDFQYSAPSETKLKQYEIWIKYRLKLRDSNDDRIADWTIKGYGKTPTGLLTSATSAFNAATNVALRDVGAQLSIRFPKQRVIKTLLDGGSPRVLPELESEPEPEPEVEEAAEVAANDAGSDGESNGQPSFDDGAPERSAQPEVDNNDDAGAEAGDKTDTEVSDEAKS